MGISEERALSRIPDTGGGGQPELSRKLGWAIVLPKLKCIDMAKTGERLKGLCKKHGIAVKMIQEELCIGSFQSVYAWFAGKTLPSLDNMFLLSKMLGVSMEEMIIGTEVKTYLTVLMDGAAAEKRLWLAVVRYCGAEMGQMAEPGRNEKYGNRLAR